MMQQLALIPFVDGDSGDDALVIVRAGEGKIGLAVSLRRDGDTLVVMPPEGCEALIAALRQAEGIARQGVGAGSEGT